MLTVENINMTNMAGKIPKINTYLATFIACSLALLGLALLKDFPASMIGTFFVHFSVVLGDTSGQAVLTTGGKL